MSNHIPPAKVLRTPVGSREKIMTGWPSAEMKNELSETVPFRMIRILAFSGPEMRRCQAQD